MPKLHIYKNEKETCQAFAGWFAQLVSDTLKVQDSFTIALSAAGIPKLFYKLLIAGYADDIDWSKVHIFRGDDKLISFSNNKGSSVLEGASLEDLPVHSAQIHTINRNLTPEAAAADYEKLLRAFFKDKSSTFDLVILGLGDEGDVLSLFPGYRGK